MTGRVGMVCAAAVLALAGGCAFQTGNSIVEVGVKVNEQVVNDTVDHVAQKLEQEMRRAGLEVTSSPEAGGGVRLTSRTRSGQKFHALVSSVPTPQGERTRVRVEWEQAPDTALWLQLAAALAAAPPTVTPAAAR